MSKKLLFHLNGQKNGQFKQWLDEFKGEPRIAWYPSSGDDFLALLYLHPGYALTHPASPKDPAGPDLFLFTDYYPWRDSLLFDNRILYSDSNTLVVVDHIEELPKLNLPPHHKELVQFTEGSPATDRAVFLKIRIENDKLGTIAYPVVYAFSENATFYCKKMVSNKAMISHIIHVRYGGGCGGGGSASGIWLLNVLKQLNCELFITDGHHHWQSGDHFALSMCKAIPRTNRSTLTPIRTVHSGSWSGHGDVSWNLVS